uniref:Uncharacterized protein n=1 Tax=Lepeophtheirus salmonis TaxID=72036 RepID=A0A0K2SX74_LEPSM
MSETDRQVNHVYFKVQVIISPIQLFFLTFFASNQRMCLYFSS